MRRLVFAAALLAVASAGIYTLVSASFAHQARTLTFAERFAPALELMEKQ
jgi:hypothetical protein